MTLRITEAFISKDNATFRYLGDDGFPAARHFDEIVVKTDDGRTWVLPNGKSVQDEDGLAGAVATYDAAVMLPKIQAHGSIRPEFWIEQEEGESFEERYAPFGTEWQLEQRDRSDSGGGIYR